MTMSVDKLVDSAQLDTDLTSVANAIRAKGGTSASLAFPADFVSAIGAIPSGGGAGWLNYVDKINTFGINGASVSGDLVIDFSGKTVTLGSQAFKCTAVNDDTTIEIKAYSVGTVTNPIQNMKKVRTLKFTTDVSPIAGSQFLNNDNLYKCLGTPITITAFGSGTYKKMNAIALTEIYFVPNQCASGGDVVTGVLIDASLVSLANALQAVSGQTITILNATTKARCSTLMGTVSQVTDGGVTYDFFTQDASGTVSLENFITQTKGWTLA